MWSTYLTCGRNSNFLEGLATPLAEGDTVAIHTPVGGVKHSKSLIPAIAPDDALRAFYGWRLHHL
jgi:hypothetical protein